jgi:2-oxoglutarate ferredoxin oxidoreductase subunit alpha
LAEDVSIVLVGAAGQGIETVADFMAKILKLSGYCVFVTREFMSRIRGGTNSLQLRVSGNPRGAFLRRTDIAVPLTKEALPHLRKYSRIDDETLVIGEEQVLKGEDIHPDRVSHVPFTQVAEGIGGRIYSNTVAAGVLLAFFDVPVEVASDYLEARFSSKGEQVVSQNIEAFMAGREVGLGLVASGRIHVNIDTHSEAKEQLLMSGTDGVALGAVAGGCNFISSYPMSPSTGVLVSLSQMANEFGIVVDQVEDEIAAINKAIGAWYAGGRALVTTSGGGFALMTEGLSLAGMLESPVVIHVAQRPGPATGLPTRTEQADLQLVLYGGHGEFPRMIFAPGNPREAFHLTHRAFNMSAKHQVPAIVLTDQFLVDSSFLSPGIELDGLMVEKHLVETEHDYRRYAFTENGVSPRGVPGYGEGLVGVDSDEHDEEGHITEDLTLRPRMVKKRLHERLKLLRKDSVPPTLYGGEDYRVLVVAWGSTLHVVREAIDGIGRSDVSMLHFSQVYPLSPLTREYLDRAETLAIVENNATCQLGKLIQLESGFMIPEEKRLLKFDGLPFPVEQVEAFLEGLGGGV